MNLYTLSVNHHAVITRIHPENAGVMWHSLNNHVEIAEMSGEGVEKRAIPQVPGNNQVPQTIIKARKGFVAMKTMAIARVSQKILAMLFQILVLSIIECGIGLLTLS